MPISNYPHAFANGVNIHENPIDVRNSNSNVFWVDSVKGSDGNKGTFLKPFATLGYAITRCTANQGDTIYVAAGHSETIVDATTLVANIAGIKILGLGNNLERPAFTFATSTAASFVISAADVLVSNLTFYCNIASQVTMIDCNGGASIIDSCEFKENTNASLTYIDVGADRVRIQNCVIESPGAGATAGIELGAAHAFVAITGCEILGDFSDACIHNPTATVLSDLTISNCTLTNSSAGNHAIELVSACTGVAKNNYMVADAFATTIDPGSLRCFECYSNASADKNGRLNPVVET